jgi:hypothetical protein
VGFTSVGREVSNEVLAELKDLFFQARSEHVAGRLWRTLSNDDRSALGGDFRKAFLNPELTIGMFRRLHPNVTQERALLEVLHDIGWIFPARYSRLVRTIGEKIDVVPTTDLWPKWDAVCGKLHYDGQVIRSIPRPKQACNIIAILDAFQQLGWPDRIDLGSLPGMTDHVCRQSLYILNKPMEAIHFRMDGQGRGILWEPK